MPKRVIGILIATVNGMIAMRHPTGSMSRIVAVAVVAVVAAVVVVDDIDDVDDVDVVVEMQNWRIHGDPIEECQCTTAAVFLSVFFCWYSQRPCYVGVD